MTEQNELLNLEIHQMHAKLQEFKEYAQLIADYKKRFVSDENQYHGVLRVWQKDLDAIFNVAERLTK